VAADEYNLERFVLAQRDSFGQALTEIRSGRKRTHWMWYVFPQVAGLGHSPAAVYYAITGIGEATAYLAHPMLGPRLATISGALCTLDRPDPAKVFGYPDNLKLRSSMTLFSCVSRSPEVFQLVLDLYFGGRGDPETLRLLGR